jgi:PASTA domain
MAFEFSRWFVGRAVIENAGVPRDTATRLALVPAIVEVPLAQSVLLSTAIGRSRAPAPAPVDTEPGPEPSLVEVPDVSGQPFERAEAALKQAGLGAKKQEVRGTGDAVVLKQEPAAQEFVPQGTVVTLFVRKISDDTGAPPEPATRAVPAESTESAAAGQSDQAASEKPRKSST